MSKKSTTIDMTAMCDVAFLLLTFFILTATAKVPEPLPVDTPSSTVQTKLPETGLVLVPRNWQDVQANAGANGTGFALIMSTDQKQAIELYDSSFCVGCGLPNATLYFPELLKESLENEFGGYKDSKKLINIVHPSKKVAFFSYQIPQVNNKTHGIAKYYDEDTFNYKEIQITLDKSQQSLVGPILNFYNATH
jgi:hypothetical protein